MSSDNYKDPEDIGILSSIIEEMKTLSSSSETIDFINKYLPGWLVGIIPKYSDDYPHLTLNWLHICDKLHTEPKKILLVDEIHFDPDYSLLNHLCEFITTQGYVVRRKEEMVACEECGNALPSVEVYEHMKKALPSKIPPEWSSKCKDCA